MLDWSQLAGLGPLHVPRTPDPQLERRVTKAALRLLDSGGLSAVTLRAVAHEAGTTTPTIYGRFADREELLHSVVNEVQSEILVAVRGARDVTDFVTRYLDFSLQHPNRFELSADTFGSRISSGQPMPVYQLLKDYLAKEVGVQGRRREDLAMAIVSLSLGTTRAAIAAGRSTPAARDLYRTGRAALRLLLKAFSS